MKCRLKDAFINILLIIFSITVEGEGYQSNSFQKNLVSPKRMSSNTYQSFESFPDLDYLDIKHHKIVKKQMGILDEMNPTSNADSREKNEAKAQKNLLASINANKKQKNKDAEDLKDFVTNFALYISRRLRRKRALGIMTKVFEGLKGINVETYKPFQKKRTKKDIHDSSSKKCGDCNFELEMPNGKQDAKDFEGQPCKHYFRFPDKCDCRCYYECEVQPDGCMRIRHKKCREDEMFSVAYSECLKPSFLKVMRKSKREPSAPKKKIDIPEMPQDDSEPANEWLDASQEVAQKIPSEFKPKPKLKLRIYHLRCKKKAGKISARRETPKHNFAKAAKLETSQPLFLHQGRKLSLHKPRKHPRSFLIRASRKEDDGDEDNIDKSSVNLMSYDSDEDTEDEDYDEEAEAEDDADEDDERHAKKETPEDKKRRQEQLKELFKTGKGTIKSKAKYNEDPGSLIRSSENFKNFDENCNIQDSESFKNRDSPKVLIDANIRFDGEITDALASILSQNKEKSLDDHKNSVTEYSNDNP